MTSSAADAVIGVATAFTPGSIQKRCCPTNSNLSSPLRMQEMVTASTKSKSWQKLPQEIRLDDRRAFGKVKLPRSVAELKCLIPAPKFCECSTVRYLTPLRVRSTALSSFCRKPARSESVNMICAGGRASHNVTTQARSEISTFAQKSGVPKKACANARFLG